MNIVKATRKYEAWLGKHTHLVASDLERKHIDMAKRPFCFLRATFYRWLQLWPEVCPGLSHAPSVLGVGDLHVENFGTWRDTDGRLVWGVNDFDEADDYPYTLDLVRLATSAVMAARQDHIAMRPKAAITALLEGYLDGMQNGGRPYVLEEDHGWLRQIALSKLRDPVKFWQKFDHLAKVRGEIPEAAREALEQLLPEHGLPYCLVLRDAGLGSRGRMRFVALADWKGGRVAREVKALAPPLRHWLNPKHAPGESQYASILERAIRCPDPCLRLHRNWVARRLSPHCSRIELTSLGAHRGELRLLEAMGRETANIHLGSDRQRKPILKDLRHRKPRWLGQAVENMAHALERDWRCWKEACTS